MTQALVAREVHAYIRDQLLAGQDEGLTPTTPLLALGILDSFGLFKLVAHLNEVYPIDLPPTDIVGEDFRDIASIAELIVRRQRATPASGSPPTAAGASDGLVVLEAPGCAQVFIMVLGQGHKDKRGRGMPQLAPELTEDVPEFFKVAGLGDRNIILFHDPAGEIVRDLLCADPGAQATTYAQVQHWLAARPHVQEIYCLGVSSGGPLAMLAGDFLRAKTVWAFAPRPARLTLGQDVPDLLDELAQRLTGKRFNALRDHLTPEDEARIDAFVTPQMVDDYYRGLLDPANLIDAGYLADLVQALSPGNGITEHRLYYVPRDACDAHVVDTLRHCAGVTPIEVAPSDPPPPSWAFSRWIHPERWICRDHLVLDLLRERGQFHTLFPAFRPAVVVAA